MGTKIDKKIKVEAKWLYNQHPNQAFTRLMRLLLHPRGDEIAETDGDENGIDAR